MSYAESSEMEIGKFVVPPAFNMDYVCGSEVQLHTPCISIPVLRM